VSTPFEPLKKGRATVSQLGGSLNVTIPAKRNIFVSAFMCIWLCGWTAGGIAAASSLFGWTHFAMHSTSGEPGGKTFLAVWLCLWVLAECAVTGQLLWVWFGKEVLVLGRDALTLTNQIFSFQRSKRFSLPDISKLRAQISDSYFNRRNVSGPNSMAFDYGRGTINFGRGLDEGEARAIIEEMQRWNRKLDAK
jgi:hypothetical protein